MNEVQSIKDRAHIERIKDAMHGRDKLLFILGINVGLRISDLLALTAGDLRKERITIRESKTGKTRTFALNDAAQDAVRTLLDPALPDDSPAFPSRKGNAPIGRVQAYRAINQAVVRAGLADEYPRIGTHSLRKTFGYHAYAAGADITLLMRVLNHASPRETLRYIGIEADDITDVYYAINL